MTTSNNTKAIPEITIKAIVLSIVLTIILSAANAYLGLKVGITLSASIPAAVISMGILRFFRNSNVLENNIVQTAASSGEALTAGIIFTVPALIVIHYWFRFDYWTTAFIAGLGGTLGVLFSVPLRKILLADESLGFPEGTAIGNVLKISVMGDVGLKNLVLGSGLGAGISLLQTGFKVLADNLQMWFVARNMVFGMGVGFAPALIGAGYIVGIEVAMSILVGIVLGWLVGVPVLSAVYGIGDVTSVTSVAMHLWSEHIRYIGLGTMMVGGLWAISTLIKPMAYGIHASIQSVKASRKESAKVIPRTERDIPINQVFWSLLVLSLPLFGFIYYSIVTDLSSFSTLFSLSLSFSSLAIVILGGLIFASVCGYFAGLVGSSTSPISSMVLISLILVSLIMVVFLGNYIEFAKTSSETTAAAAIAILITALISAAASISNDTIQDLKAGQMVGATPWKQQVMLILGVVTAALTIPFILQLLFDAYGIAGVFPRPGMDPSQMLLAPQAGLMATVVQGMFSHDINWPMMLIGAGIAIVVLIVDKYLERYNVRLPILAVGIGIYLPVDTAMPLVIGGVLSYLVHRNLKKREQAGLVTEEAAKKKQQTGLLIASGLVAGAAVMGVLLAIPFAISGSTRVLALVGPGFVSYASILGLLTTLAVCYWIYQRVLKA